MHIRRCCAAAPRQKPRLLRRVNLTLGKDKIPPPTTSPLHRHLVSESNPSERFRAPPQPTCTEEQSKHAVPSSNVKDLLKPRLAQAAPSPVYSFPRGQKTNEPSLDATLVVLPYSTRGRNDIAPWGMLSTCLPCIPPPWTKLPLPVTPDLHRYSAMAPSLSTTWPTHSSYPQHGGKMASDLSLVALETPPPESQGGQGWARFT